MKKTKWIVLILVTLFITGAFFASRVFFAKADTMNFYPTTCLGGWTNPDKATGQPEVSDSNSAVFGPDNSAILPASTSADIFCGNFKGGDIPDTDYANKIILTLSWDVVKNDPVKNISSTNFDTSAGQILDATSTPAFTLVNATSTTVVATTTIATSSISSSTVDQSVAATTTVATTSDAVDPVAPTVTPEVAPTNDTTDASSSVQSLAPTKSKVFSLVDLFIKKAYADTPAQATDTITSDTNGDQFLEVLYTIDGSNWHILGTVDAEHLHYSVFEIPLPGGITKWSDISNIQIAVKSLPTISNSPAVYLDGMQLQVDYHEISADIFSSESGLYIPVGQSDSNFFNFAIRKDEKIEELVISGAAPIGNVAVFDAASSQNLLTTYVDGGTFILQPEYFGKGSYVFVVTNDPNSCSGLSLDACITSSNFIGKGEFTVDTKDVQVQTVTLPVDTTLTGEGIGQTTTSTTMASSSVVN